MPFTHYRTRGIFLVKKDRGEADQLLTIFTENFGKLEVLARAVRKITSKLRPGAELFYLSEIEFIQGKIYKTLTDAVLIDKFKDLKENPEKLELAYLIADALDFLTGQEEKDDKIWALLNKTLQEIENCKIENSLEIRNLKLEIIYYYFLWKLFSFLGYAPELYSCAICQKKLLPETFYFLPGEGGVVCWNCLAKLADEEKQQAKEITVDTVKVLRIFLKEDWSILEKLKTDNMVLDNLKDISRLYLAFLKEEFPKPER